MIKLGGYIFTLFFLAGVFHPSAFHGTAGQLSQISGHLAFSFFALLVARGARRTSNHFMYFVRLLLAALATEIISFAATLTGGVYFPSRNALFTYAAAIALIAGISMAIGCYHDLVAHAIPAGGELNKKLLFGLPVNPGNYRIAPAAGIILGLATAGLAVFVTLFFDFAYGLFGLLYILLAFIAMRDSSAPQRTIVPDSVFSGIRECARTLLSVTALTALAFLIAFFFKPLRARIPLAYLATVVAVPLASILPERPLLPPGVRRLLYAFLPAVTGIFFLLRLLLK